MRPKRTSLRMSRKGEIRGGAKATALCVGGHGAGNNSQIDLMVYLYEKKNGNMVAL